MSLNESTWGLRRIARTTAKRNQQPVDSRVQDTLDEASLDRIRKKRACNVLIVESQLDDRIQVVRLKGGS
jgi:hypothetical protein